MTVESALYPQQLNTAWPQASDMVSEGDNHIRLTKTVIKTTFPNVAGVVSATDVQLSYVTGVTSAIQAQIDSKGAIAGQTWTGAHIFSGSAAVPTLAQGTSTTGAASTAFVQAEWATRLPNYSVPITASSAELNRLVGVTSGVQGQIDAKGAIAGQTWTGAHVFPSTTTIGGLTPTIRGYLETVTSDAQAQLNARALKAGDTYSGTHDFTGAAVTVPTATAGDSTNKAASTAFVMGAVGAVGAPQVAAAIHAATSKATPVDADELGLSDSAASWSLKKLTFANLKAWIGGLFVSKSGDTINGDLNFGGTGRRITGDFSNAIEANRVFVQTSIPNSNTTFGSAPSGTAIVGAFRAYGKSDVDNSEFAQLAALGGIESRITAGATGSGTLLPLTCNVGGAERLRIDPTTGNVLVTGGGGLGYGVGSGGTVTQPTSKSTSVTLNKPSGQITMDAAVLNATSTVAFTLVNSLIAAGDTLSVEIAGGVANFSAYRVVCGNHGVAGQRGIAITNQSPGSLSEAVVLRYSVIKGSAS